MKMKPILFNTPMVQAILDGRKTMTRRIAKRIPEETHRVEQISDNEFEAYWGGYVPDLKGFVDGSTIIKSPYQPGDILWVRETWQHFCLNRNTMPNCFAGHSEYCFKASLNDTTYGCCGEGGCKKWRPSIFMPREAARIFLRVRKVWVERVQDISEEDAKAEGVNPIVDATLNILPNGYRLAFNGLWNELNSRRGYGWDVNPWLFVYEFERVDKLGEELK